MVRAPDLDILRAQIKSPGAPKDLLAYLITSPWADSLSQLTTSLGTVPQRVASASPTAQTASIGLTTLPTSGSSGVFVFTYHADITVPASVSSSLIVTLTYTQNGVAKSKAWPAITGNTNSTVDSQTWMPVVDANTPISYSTTYASVGTAMQYGLVVILQSVQL